MKSKEAERIRWKLGVVTSKERATAFLKYLSLDSNKYKPWEYEYAQKELSKLYGVKPSYLKKKKKPQTATRRSAEITIIDEYKENAE